MSEIEVLELLVEVIESAKQRMHVHDENLTLAILKVCEQRMDDAKRVSEFR